MLSAVIYFAVGYHVFHQRNQLRNLSLSTQGKDLTGDSTDVRDSAEKVCHMYSLCVSLLPLVRAFAGPHPASRLPCHGALAFLSFFERAQQSYHTRKVTSRLLNSREEIKDALRYF